MEEMQNEQEILKHEGQTVKYNMYIQVSAHGLQRELVLCRKEI